MNKKYAVMLFETGLNLGTTHEPNKWVNYKNVYFNDGLEALNYYVDTPCLASQLVEGKDEFELQCRMGEMILNYMDDNWLNENLYPYL